MTINEYQKDCFLRYKKSIEYPEHYIFYYGNPLNVLVPIETATNGIMVVGAYPSAKFFTLEEKNGNKITDVPLYDNDSPFSNETYFDGSRTRTIPSGQELNDVILKNIGVERKECWITDLVKVFLFKEGHIKRYESLGKRDLKENRSSFSNYAKLSIPWLEREIEIANPYVVILLGTEVTATVFNVSEKQSKEKLNGISKQHLIGKHEVNIISLPHPGILMKKMKRNPWPQRFISEIAPTAKKEIIKLREKNILKTSQ